MQSADVVQNAVRDRAARHADPDDDASLGARTFRRRALEDLSRSAEGVLPRHSLPSGRCASAGRCVGSMRPRRRSPAAADDALHGEDVGAGWKAARGRVIVRGVRTSSRERASSTSANTVRMRRSLIACPSRRCFGSPLGPRVQKDLRLGPLGANARPALSRRSFASRCACAACRAARTSASMRSVRRGRRRRSSSRAAAKADQPPRSCVLRSPSAPECGPRLPEAPGHGWRQGRPRASPPRGLGSQRDRRRRDCSSARPGAGGPAPRMTRRATPDARPLPATDSVWRRRSSAGGKPACTSAVPMRLSEPSRRHRSRRWCRSPPGCVPHLQTILDAASASARVTPRACPAGGTPIVPVRRTVPAMARRNLQRCEEGWICQTRCVRRARRVPSDREGQISERAWAVRRPSGNGVEREEGGTWATMAGGETRRIALFACCSRLHSFCYSSSTYGRMHALQPNGGFRASGEGLRTSVED